MTSRTWDSLTEGEYQVEIDAAHVDGELNWGEAYLPGDSREEILFSTHVCHPQLANDNLSGLVVLTALAAELAERSNRRFSYRFLFVPATIGPIRGWRRDPRSASTSGTGSSPPDSGTKAPFTTRRRVVVTRRLITSSRVRSRDSARR